MDAARLDESAAAAGTGQVYRTLVEHANYGIAVVQDARFVFANPSFGALGGRRPEELVGMHVADVIHPADLPSVLARYEAELRGESVENRYEIRIRRPDGEMRWVGISVVAMQWQGRPASLGFVTDITTRREIETRLKSALAAIFSSTEILRCYAARLSEDDKEDLYDSIEAGVRHMTGMVESVLGSGQLGDGSRGSEVP